MASLTMQKEKLLLFDYKNGRMAALMIQKEKLPLFGLKSGRMASLTMQKEKLPLLGAASSRMVALQSVTQWLFACRMGSMNLKKGRAIPFLEMR